MSVITDIGAAAGSIATGLPSLASLSGIFSSVSNDVSSIIKMLGIRGKTQHLSSQQAEDAAHRFADPISAELGKLPTDKQLLLAEAIAKRTDDFLTNQWTWQWSAQDRATTVSRVNGFPNTNLAPEDMIRGQLLAVAEWIWERVDASSKDEAQQDLDFYNRGVLLKAYADVGVPAYSTVGSGGTGQTGVGTGAKPFLQSGFGIAAMAVLVLVILGILFTRSQRRS